MKIENDENTNQITFLERDLKASKVKEKALKQQLA